MTTPSYDAILNTLDRQATDLERQARNLERQAKFLNNHGDGETEAKDARLLREAKSIIEAFREIEEECSNETHCFNYEEAEVCQCGGFKADGSPNDPYREGAGTTDFGMKPTGDTV